MLWEADWKFEIGRSRIPVRMQGAIHRWIANGIRPGRFLCAVIANNLRDTTFAADDENILLLRDYVLFFYNYAPGQCWGSADALETWRGEKDANAKP